MHFASLLLLLPAAAAAAGFNTAFTSWAARWGKVYPSPAAEGAARRQFFATELEIAAHNTAATTSPLPSFLKGHNQFSDLSNAEFERLVHISVGGKPVAAAAVPTAATLARLAAVDAPESINWVTEGKVSPVKVRSEG